MFWREDFEDYSPLSLPRYLWECISSKHQTSKQAEKKKKKSSETHLGFAMLTCKSG